LILYDLRLGMGATPNSIYIHPKEGENYPYGKTELYIINND